MYTDDIQINDTLPETPNIEPEKIIHSARLANKHSVNDSIINSAAGVGVRGS